MTLVASSRPPSPTSSTVTSTAASAIAIMAIAVTCSKNVSAWPPAPRSCSAAATIAGSEIISPSNAIRSRRHDRCGDV
jgi:hypothetical protein